MRGKPKTKSISSSIHLREAHSCYGEKSLDIFHYGPILSNVINGSVTTGFVSVKFITTVCVCQCDVQLRAFGLYLVCFKVTVSV